MIDTHRNVIRYQIENELHYERPDFLAYGADLIEDEKLDKQNNGRNIILFDVFFGNLFNFNIFIMIQYSDSNGKNWGDTPSATLNSVFDSQINN